jgi:hypothetical protein
VFVYSLHREVHGWIYSTDKLPGGSRILSLGSSRSLAREIIDQFQGQTMPVESVPMVPAAHKCINGFFLLRPVLISRPGRRLISEIVTLSFNLDFINMVPQSSFCGKALENANAHLQHFLEISSTITI